MTTKGRCVHPLGLVPGRAADLPCGSVEQSPGRKPRYRVFSRTEAGLYPDGGLSCTGFGPEAPAALVKLFREPAREAA
jgi:hypothetical protein